MTDEATRTAVEATDYPVLQRIIDGHCAARDWGSLDRLRVLCRHAAERGKQLWAVEEHIRYRLALEAPGSIAGAVVAEGPARFTLGPLPEVAASTHTWNELDAALPPGPWRSTVAHERAVRGEALSSMGVESDIYEMPLELQAWEPRYCLAEYKADRVEQNGPDPVALRPIETDRSGVLASEEHDSVEALRLLTSAWVEQSSGRSETRAVEGDVLAAIGALGPSRASLAAITPGEALRWMAWAASVGGVYGRRRGAAAGRFGAWWAATHLVALDWPPHPDDLGAAIEELGWFVWSDGSTGGWALNLAVEDADNGVAWATTATDSEPETSAS
jgi:hypothetical protein